MKKKKKLFLIKLFSLFALVLGCLGFFIFSSKVYAYTIPSDSQPIVSNNNVFAFNGLVSANNGVSVEESYNGYIGFECPSSFLTSSNEVIFSFPIVRASDYNLDFYADRDIIFMASYVYWTDAYSNFEFGKDDDDFLTWYDNIETSDYYDRSSRQSYKYVNGVFTQTTDTLWLNYRTCYRKITSDSFAINRIKITIDNLEDYTFPSLGQGFYIYGLIGYADEIFDYINTDKTLYLDEVMTQQVYNEVQSQFANRLNDANNTIAEQQDTIAALQEELEQLQISYDWLQEDYDMLEENYQIFTENNLSWEKIFYNFADIPIRTVANILGFGQGAYFFGINLFDAFIGMIVALGMIWLIKRFI